MSKERNALLALAAASACWGMSGMMRFIPAGESPLAIAALRALVAALYLFVLLRTMRNGEAPQALNVKAGLLFIIAAAGNAGCQLTYVQAARQISPYAALSLLGAGTIVTAALIELMSADGRRNWQRRVLATITICGLSALSLLDSPSKPDLEGLILSCVSGALWGISTKVQGKLEERYRLWSYIAASIFLGASAAPGLMEQPPRPATIAICAALGVFTLGLPLQLWSRGLRQIKDAHRASCFLVVESFVSVIPSCLSNSLPGPWSAVGLTLALLVVALYLWNDGEPQKGGI